MGMGDIAPKMGMETVESLFEKAKLLNPDLTKEKFLEKRAEALKVSSAEGPKVGIIGGEVIDQNNLNSDTVKELLENQKLH